MMNEPELMFYGGYKLLEAPCYNNETSVLYFVAIRYNMIFALNTRTLEFITYKTDGPVGGVVTVENGDIIECEKHGIYRISSATRKKEFLCHIITDPTMRYNHIIRDSYGRLLVGIMGDEKRENNGGLYSYSDGKCCCIQSGTTVANGTALSADEKKLYFTDSATQEIWEYDYDIKTGMASNRRTILTFQADDKPDGLFVDMEGKLYVSIWNGARVSVFDKETWTKIRDIYVPSKHATACCIGGTMDEYLYITTAKGCDDDTAPAGGLFRMRIK